MQHVPPPFFDKKRLFSAGYSESSHKYIPGARCIAAVLRDHGKGRVRRLSESSSQSKILNSHSGLPVPLGPETLVAIDMS